MAQMKYLLIFVALFMVGTLIDNLIQLTKLTQEIAYLTCQEHNKSVSLYTEGWALSMDSNKPELCLTDRNGHFFTLGESDFNSMSKQNHTIKELKKHIHYFQVTIP